jgi:transposase
VRVPNSDPRDERIAELEGLLQKERARVAELEKLVARLRREIEQLRRRGKRQAAPFSREQRSQQPGRPGRKPGEGSFVGRSPPAPNEVTERIQVEPPTSCPCGGDVEAAGFEEVSTTEMPPAPKPVINVYKVPLCRCLTCGRVVRGRHPDVAEDQYGATAHRVGPRAMAAAHVLHYEVGIPVQKVPGVLKELTGIRVTQSAITQDALRRAEREVGDEYQQLRAKVKTRSVVHTDDTGWRINGKPAQLMTFVSPKETVFQIRDQHRNEEVREVLPETFKGTMVTDRGPSYDAKVFDDVNQQKCMFHALRSVDAVLETKVGKARWFGETLQGLFQRALGLWHDFHDGLRPLFKLEAAQLQEEATEHLRPRKLGDVDNQRLLNEFGWHHERGNLLRFLSDPRIPPTNNAAERELRPAVIARKVSHCSKNERGAHAHSAFASVLRTLKRRGAPSLVEALYEKFRGITPESQPP